MKRLFFLLSSFFICITAFAQFSIQSRIIDANNGQIIDYATVRLLRAADSTFVSGSISDEEGKFEIANVSAGRYILSVSFLGYVTETRNVNIRSQNVVLPDIRMREDSHMLAELVIEGQAVQMLVRGDTLEYNADAFNVTENAVVEDLLKKLPGVEVDREGKITVNGESITRITIDGKKFFDGDIEMATKNIPADMIEKIQVLDQQSEMARLTGFDDGETERIINLTTRSNRRKGVFGNVTVGAGADIDEQFRYDNNAFLNVMNNDAQTAITGGANNVNTVRSARGRGGWGMQNGITSTQNIGINNNTILNPKLKIGGDGMFNHSSNETLSETNRESFVRGSIFNDSTSSKAHYDNYVAVGRAELEWTIDSFNTLVIQPNINYTNAFSDIRREYWNQKDGEIISDGFSRNHGESQTVGVGLNAIYSRKFAQKKGRSLTFNLRADFSDINSDNYIESEKNDYVMSDTTINVNQKVENRSNRYNTNLRLSYVEPLWNINNQVEIAAAFRYTRNTSDREQRDVETGDLDFDYSNNFESDFFSETFELNYRHIAKDYNLMLGFQGEPSQINSRTIYANGETIDISNNVINFAPRARFQYNLAKRKSLRFDYRGSTVQPSVNQMQPVKDNSNLMNETVGNASLKPAFNNRASVRYSSSNPEKFSSFTFNLNGSFTQDALVTNSVFDATGKQYTQTVNATKMPFNIASTALYNVPLSKKIRFNTRTGAGYNARHGYSKFFDEEEIDAENLPLGDLSTTRRVNMSEQLSLTYNHSWLEIGARGSAAFSNTTSNLNNNANETWDLMGTGNILIRLPKKINISSDINYITRMGYSNFDRDELIWNATIDITLLKDKGILALSAKDILQQRLNINQIVGDNYIQYTETNALRSYFMLSFTYKISQFAGGASEQDMRNRNRREAGPSEDRQTQRFINGNPASEMQDIRDLNF